jgi:hypothetical protein
MAQDIDITHSSITMNYCIPTDRLPMNYNKGEPSNQNNTSFTTHQDAVYPAATAQTHIRGLRDLGISMNSQRNASQNHMRGAASACIDQDDSGTYDPNESSGKSSRTQPRRTKKARQEDEDAGVNQEPKVPRHNTVGYSLPVTLTFASEQALNYLRSITPGPFDDQATSLDDPSRSLDPDDYTSLPRRKVKKPNRLGAGVARYIRARGALNATNNGTETMA